MDQQAIAPAPGEIMMRGEAAALLRVHAHTLDRWRYTGEGPPWHQPRGKRGRVVYLRSELLAWLRGAA
jgi:hypothetical protein